LSKLALFVLSSHQTKSTPGVLVYFGRLECAA
jgi:hypothetical protein